MFKILFSLATKLPLINRVFYRNEISFRKLNQVELIQARDFRLGIMLDPNVLNTSEQLTRVGKDSNAVGKTPEGAQAYFSGNSAFWRLEIIKVKR